MMGKSTGRQEQLRERAPQAANQEFLLDGSELLGRKWHTPILYHRHRRGAMRVSDLRRESSGISGKMRSQSLDALTAEYGLVERTEISDSPVRVDYSLSPVGEELKPLLLALREWGTEHRPTAETESHE